jgi:hypothetical protein
MKGYLITTGSIFTLVGAAHVLRTIAEWRRLAVDPWFFLEGPGLGLVAGALGLWAWRLLRQRSRLVAKKPDATAP